MKKLKGIIFLVLIFCMLLSMQIYAANASVNDIFITCAEDGTVDSGTSEAFTKANITVSGLDQSGYYKYIGIDVGVFKKLTVGEYWDTINIERIMTESLEIQVEDFGDMTKYEYDTVYTLGYRILYRPNGLETNPIVEDEWTKVENSYFKVRNTKFPTINTPTITGTGYYGDNASVSATGTNIAQVKYRIFYTTESTAPSIDAGNSDTPGAGWVDSGIIGDLTVNNSTYISGDILGSNLNNISWNYAVFKIAAASSTNDWVCKYTPSYKLSNNPNNISSGTEVDTYINNVAHNQVIDLKDGTEMVVTDPDTPAGNYTLADVNKLELFNTFINNDYVKYRLEFNVSKPEPIQDLKIILDLNSLNEDGIELLISGVDFYKKADDGSLGLIKRLNYTKYRAGCKNKYITSIGKDNSGMPMIIANGAGKYVIEYSGILKVSSLQSSFQNQNILTENESQIRIYGGNGKYIGTIDLESPSNKFYIDTKVYRGTVNYR